MKRWMTTVGAVGVLVLGALAPAAAAPDAARPAGAVPAEGGCGQDSGGTPCGAGGSQTSPGTGNGGSNASTGTSSSESWVNQCGVATDIDGDGQTNYDGAWTLAPEGYSVTPNGCTLTFPDGTVATWHYQFSAWLTDNQQPMPEQAPPPTWCTGYNTNGQWYYGVVALTDAPQPIWGDINSNGVGTCPTPGMNPQMIAEQVVSAFVETRLQTGEIGITPPADDPNASGTVGLPTWLWISNPSEGTVGPEIRESIANGPVTVDLVATLDDTTFDMGDGNTLTCTYDEATGTVGTPYDATFQGDESPSGCSYVYETTSAGQDGEVFAVTAQSHWTVTWSVTTAAGTEQGQVSPTTPPTETTVRISELQTILQPQS